MINEFAISIFMVMYKSTIENKRRLSKVERYLEKITNDDDSVIHNRYWPREDPPAPAIDGGGRCQQYQ